LDCQTGETVWKIDRPNNTRSYVTPIIRQIDGRTQMILSGSKCVASYDPRDGSQHWIIDGPTEQFVASLVYNGKLLFLTAGYPEHHLLAIRPDGHGNVTRTHVAWRETRGASYVPSPLAVGDYFLVVSDDGIASCFQADTGHRHWQHRLGTHFSASPVTANGLVYFLADDGLMQVVRPVPSLSKWLKTPWPSPASPPPPSAKGRSTCGPRNTCTRLAPGTNNHHRKGCVERRSRRCHCSTRPQASQPIGKPAVGHTCTQVMEC
jgi:outer membrane protein assembly factor BamB